MGDCSDIILRYMPVMRKNRRAGSGCMAGAVTLGGKCVSVWSHAGIRRWAGNITPVGLV